MRKIDRIFGLISELSGNISKRWEHFTNLLSCRKFFLWKAEIIPKKTEICSLFLDLFPLKLWNISIFPNKLDISPTKHYPSTNLDTAQHWPSIAKNLPKIGCQYRAVAGMITLVCTWRPILAQTLAASTCFRYRNVPMLCRTLVKMTIGLV